MVRQFSLASPVFRAMSPERTKLFQHETARQRVDGRKKETHFRKRNDLTERKAIRHMLLGGRNGISIKFRLLLVERFKSFLRRFAAQFYIGRALLSFFDYVSIDGFSKNRAHCKRMANKKQPFQCVYKCSK